jgi:hypothetical protein
MLAALLWTHLDMPMSTEHPLMSHVKIHGLLQSSLIVYRIAAVVEDSRNTEGESTALYYI